MLSGTTYLLSSIIIMSINNKAVSSTSFSQFAAAGESFPAYYPTLPIHADNQIFFLPFMPFYHLFSFFVDQNILVSSLFSAHSSPQDIEPCDYHLYDAQAPVILPFPQNLTEDAQVGCPWVSDKTLPVATSRRDTSECHVRVHYMYDPTCVVRTRRKPTATFGSAPKKSKVSS